MKVQPQPSPFASLISASILWIAIRVMITIEYLDSNKEVSYSISSVSFWQAFVFIVQMNYICLYLGPPPPSGAVHLILSNGHFLWQVLQ